MGSMPQHKVYELPEFGVSEESSTKPPELLEEVDHTNASESTEHQYQIPDFVESKELTQGEIDQQDIEKSQRFESTSFIREESLLSSAEEYSHAIRRGADIYAQQKKEEADTYFEEAQELKESLEGLKLNLEEQQRAVIADAQAEVNRIKEEAHKEGFEQGRIEGKQQRYAEFEPQVQQMAQLLEQLGYLRQVVRFQAEQELVQLAVLVAKHVVYEELSLNPNAMIQIVKRLLFETESAGQVMVSLNPADYEFVAEASEYLQQALTDQQRLTLSSNPHVNPGEVALDTNDTIIQYTLDQQFSSIEEMLSQKIHERQRNFHTVDMDAYDFQPPHNDSLVAEEPITPPGNLPSSLDPEA